MAKAEPCIIKGLSDSSALSNGRSFTWKNTKPATSSGKWYTNILDTTTTKDRISPCIIRHLPNTTLVTESSYLLQDKTLDSVPNPVLAGWQPVCINRPGDKRMYREGRQGSSMNDQKPLSLDIRQQCSFIFTIFKFQERRT